MRPIPTAEWHGSGEDREDGPNLAAAADYFGSRLAFEIDCVTLWKRLRNAEPSVVIDVRSARSFARGHIPGATNRPAGLMEASALSTAHAPIFICGAGSDRADAYAAALALVMRGIAAKVVTGGFPSWEQNGFEIERAAPDSGEMTAI